MGRVIGILVIVAVLGGGAWLYFNNSAAEDSDMSDTVAGMADDAMDTAEDMAADTADAMDDMADAAEEVMASDDMDEVELINRDLLFGNPERTQGRISPDGSMMSFLAPLDGVLNIWVAPAGDFDAARPITNDTGRGIGFHTWVWNGDYVLYLQDTGGNENNHVYAVNVETGETRDLTPVEEGVNASIYSGSARHPDEIIIGMNDRNPQLFDPYRLNVVTGEMTLIEENPGFAAYDFDEDLTPRLAVGQTPSGGFMVYRTGEDGWAPWMEVPPEDSLNTSTLFFNEEGDGFYILSSVGRNTGALYEVDYESGEQTLIAENDQADISDVFAHPVTNEILAVAAEYERTEWTVVSDSVAADFAFLDEQLNGDFEMVNTSADFNQWMVAETSTAEPLHYHLYDREAGTLTFLFTARPELDEAPLVDMHPVVIEARDGLSLVSYYSLPAGADADGDGIPEEALPTVLYVHGGPWSRDSYGYDTIHQWLTNRGYAVLSVNYRGSTGFGKDFIEAATHEFAGAMHDDLIDAMNWAVDAGISDEDQVAIMGGSYGGYATLVGMTFTPETFACGVDIVGPSNLITLIESFPDYWAPFLEASWYRRVGDPRTEEGRAILEAASPLTRADDIVRPLLIGQGGNDPRVTKNESDQLSEVMVENGQQVTYINYPDEGHGFARPENRDSFFAITEVFLSECLGGRYQPLGDFEGSSTEVIVGGEHIPGLEEALEGFEPTVHQ